MAIREFTYTVMPDSITAATVSKGGVQREHQATKVNFVISEALKSKLLSLRGEDDGKNLLYRFDLYDGTGGKDSTDPVGFDPKKETEFSHLIQEHQTRYGGTIQVYFVITLVNDKNAEGDKTELELYSYCVKLMLKALPSGEEAEGENYESITTLASVAKANADIAVDAASVAVKARDETVTARAALEGTWIFDGGGPSDTGDIDIEFGVDSEIVEDSTNLVRSKGIKKYVDGIKTEIDAKTKGLEENVAFKADLKSLLLDIEHPVGSVYIANDKNTIPSALFGGEWELIDKEFKSVSLVVKVENDETYFKPSENISVVRFGYVSSGHNIEIHLRLKIQTEMTDDEKMLGQFQFDKLGIRKLPDGIFSDSVYSDNHNAGMAYSISDIGELSCDDIWDTDSISPVERSFHLHMSLTNEKDMMLDDFCDKFYWKRVEEAANE